MEKANAIGLAKALGLVKINTTKRAGWVVCGCPFAFWNHEHKVDKHPSFGIRYGKRKDTLYCFSCGWGGDAEDLLYELAVRTRGQPDAAKRIKAARQFISEKPILAIGAEEEEDDDYIEEWPEWYIAGFPPAYDHPYLSNRQGGPVPYAVAAAMDFRLDRKRQRLGVPVRDFDGRLMGFHGRTINDHEIKYLAYLHEGHYNKPIWYGEHCVDFSKPVLVVESVFDLARALQCYRNTVCPLYASPPKQKVERLSPATRIIDLFDNDKAGKGGSSRLRKWLPDTTIISPGLPAGYKDPGEMPVEVLAARLKHYLPLDDLILP